MKKLLIVTMLLAASTAYADNGTVVSGGDVFYAVLAPIMMAAATAAAAVITAVAGLAVAWLKKRLNLSDAEAAKIGLEIDAQHRAAFQAALTNAGGLAIQKLGEKAATVQIDIGNPAIKAAVDYVIKSAPDAIQHFNLQGRADEIAEKIIAKLPQVTASTVQAK